MNYVLDACVAVKWVITEALSHKAQGLRAEFRNGVHRLAAPDVFPIEVAHALSKAERQGRITPPQGATLWMDVMATPPRLFPSLPLVPRAFAIATQHRIGIYDCLYIALAEQEQCELVTSDDKLVNNLKPRFPFIVPLSSRP